MKIIIFESIWPRLNWASFLEATGEVVLIGLSLKWNHHKQIDPLLQCVADLD